MANRKWESTTARRVYGETKHGERVLHALFGGKIYAPPFGADDHETAATAGGQVDVMSADGTNADVRVTLKGDKGLVNERWALFEPGVSALPPWAEPKSSDETDAELAALIERLATADAGKRRAAVRQLARILGEQSTPAQ